MDYDDVIERAGNDVCGAGWVLNDIQLQGILRALPDNAEAIARVGVAPH